MFIPSFLGTPILAIFSHYDHFQPQHSQHKSLWENYSESYFREQRQKMVAQQIKRRGIKNPQVLDAMSEVPRHYFVPRDCEQFAYNDSPLAIDYGQTISQPYIVAYMTEIADIKPTDKILEIGTGSGYQAAILGKLAPEVYTIEIIPKLANRARQTLEKLGYQNIYFRIGDGHQGWIEHAPYHKILVTAAPTRIPEALTDQLALNGKLIIPVGGLYHQEILVITKTNNGLIQERTLPVRFVPMTSNQ